MHGCDLSVCVRRESGMLYSGAWIAGLDVQVTQRECVRSKAEERKSMVIKSDHARRDKNAAPLYLLLCSA